MDWDVTMNDLLRRKQLHLKLITQQGIWVDPVFYLVDAPPDGRVSIEMSYYMPHRSYPTIHSNVPVQQDHVDSYAKAMKKLFNVVWNHTLCDSCHHALVPPGRDLCTWCSEYNTVKIQFDETMDCCLCQDLEPPKFLRKLCGICKQGICMRCWLQYSNHAICPHCKQQYHRLTELESSSEDDN
jgi:hypothetical protein